jgi:uncharacterized protein (DUF302 family)
LRSKNSKVHVECHCATASKGEFGSNRLNCCLIRRSSGRQCPILGSFTFAELAGTQESLLAPGLHQIIAKEKKKVTKGPPLLTFRIDEAHRLALRMVRRAFQQHGLRTAAELDITARIKQELGAGVAPCVVLYVDDPAGLLEAVVFHRGAALLIPQPVVVTGDNRHTEVVVRSFESLTFETPASVRNPLLDLHSRITQAMETIADSQAAYLTVRSEFAVHIRKGEEQ